MACNVYGFFLDSHLFIVDTIIYMYVLLITFVLVTYWYMFLIWKM